MINFDVISLCPKVFDSLNHMGVVSKAINKNLIKINLYNLREFGQGSYKQVDDEPYGGGSGMVLKPEPIYKAFESIERSKKSASLLMTPQGKVFKQKDLFRWSTFDQLIIICGQYEGFDERVRKLVDEEISTGDYILTGGEIPAISIINGISRLVPGTLGDPNSLLDESHNSFLLEYPQYTRPPIYRGMNVPDILLSGNHQKIKSWRNDQMIKRTHSRRKDLIENLNDTNLDLNEKENQNQTQSKIFKDIYDHDNYPEW